MEDFNFFQPYICEPVRTNSKRLILISSATVAIFALFFYPAMNYIQIKNIKHNIDTMDQTLQSAVNQEKISFVKEKQQNLQVLQADLNALNYIDEKLKGIDIINDDLLIQIASKIPQGVFLEAMNITTDQIQIQGSAQHKFVIAQMEYDLRNTKKFDEVFIPTISEKDGFYSFSITFKVKEASEDGIKQ